ncbi:MAG: hypothetical protein U1D97_02320 [Desulfuromonadales bacterium]|nr:hypothetical protein [Desulfuromonadales bacterium]
MIRRALVLLLLTITLVGCTTNLLRPPREEWPEIGREFGKSLRWSGADLAATFFTASTRSDFLTAYSDTGTALQITNVRHDASGPAVGDKAQGVVTIEYYRSPSVSVKTATIPLEWICVEGGSLLPCRWQISTVLSRLP